MKVLMAAPFSTNGRYQGGIHSIVNDFINSKEELSLNKLEVIPFNTCIVNRKTTDTGRISLKNFSNFLKIKKGILKELKKNKPEILYFHSSIGIALIKDLLVIKKIKRHRLAKTILHIHSADFNAIFSGSSILKKIVMNLLKKYVDYVVFLSREIKSKFVEIGISKNKCSVIYNFSTLNYDWSEIEKNKKKSQILYMGMLTEKKGFFDLLEVLSNVNIEYKLIVCGGFLNKNEEERFTSYKNVIGKNLEFLGFVSGEIKRKAFLESNVFCLPSYSEGLPVTILEAFSAGCYVISTTVGANKEIIDDENGSLINPGDLNALKKTIEKSLKFSEKETTLIVEKIYNKSKQFTIKDFVKKTADVCSKVINRDLEEI